MARSWRIGAGLFGIGLIAACSASSGAGDDGAGGGGASGGAAGDGGGVSLGGSSGDGGAINLDSGSGGSNQVGDSGCSTYTDEAKQTYEPADIIWAVDTSGSMLEEAAAVQTNINAFSQQIGASGIDVHVVMLASYPFFFLPGICVPAPLGSGLCPPNGSDTLLPNFWHHPTAVIESVDAALRLVQFFPDYKFMLRAGVKKYVVVVTDDDSKNNPNSSGDAGKYDNNPTGFINDFNALDPMMNGTWKLSAIYSFTQCANAANVGTVWKQIVAATGGVEGDICNCPPGQVGPCAQTFQKVFDELAKKIITGSKPLACEWTIPPPEPGKTLDPNKVNVEFVDQAKGTPETIYHVDDASKCDATLGGWYYNDNQNPTTIKLCPASCNLVTGAAQGSKMNVVFGCATLNIPK
ncbi:MAG: hypothetical protein KJ015_16190 [Myxococcales bacterium]|nr:hypothetical protein [Myxococcales bacterium]